ncbi:MAG: twin-arginine translocase TatA/TatE family subunit [Nitrospira sp.]|nr:twin-arginine translocase TatA/TatE family subunit [Nitrospira sp.]
MGFAGKIFSDDVLHERQSSRRCVNICRANNRTAVRRSIQYHVWFVRLDGALLILIIVLIIFEPGKFPQLGEWTGKAIKGFKKSVHEADAIDDGKRDLTSCVSRRVQQTGQSAPSPPPAQQAGAAPPPRTTQG